MQIPKVVFVHIPKAAGTSQLKLFETIFDPERIFWWPRVDGKESRGLHPPASSYWQVAGGHIPIANFDTQANSLALYLSLLKEPVERIFSLFNYFARPGNAIEGFERRAREKAHQEMLDDGLDVSSIRNSIEKSEKFRELCTNSQCRHLSAGAASLEGVRDTLAGLNHVIGTTQDMAKFHGRLRAMFQWNCLDVVANKSRYPLDSALREEPGLIDLIESLNREDIELFRYVSEGHGGIWSRTSDQEVLQYYLSAPAQCQPADLAGLDAVVMCAPEKVDRTSANAFQVPVVIANNSARTLYALRERGLFASYRLIDAKGCDLEQPGKRTLIPCDVASGDKQQVTIDIEIPTRLFKQVSAVRVSLLYEGKAWFETHNAEHPATIKLV